MDRYIVEAEDVPFVPIETAAGGKGVRPRSLDLLAPQVPLAQINGGIGWSDVADPTKTVTVLVVPYFGVIAGDQINLYWGDPSQIVAHYTIDNPDIGAYPLQVPVSAIHQAGEGTVTVFYTVTSGIIGGPVRSPTTSVAVKLSIPGGPDPDPATPYENEKLAAPQVPFPLIGEPEANAGFNVTIQPWPNMSADDRLILSWGGQRVYGPSPLTVGQPVPVRIDRATVLAGGDGDGLVVRYEIRDRVNNWSLWSPKAMVDVDVGLNSLPAPLLLDAPGGVLDLDALGGRDTQVLVLAYPGMAAGDTVELVWAGRTFDGNPVDNVQDRRVPQAGSFLNFMVKNEVIAAIAQGQAVVRYFVYPAGGGAPISSKRVTISVKGAVRPLLAKPVVREASGGVLDPAAATQGATVEIAPWTAMSPGDEVFLWWVGTTASGSTTLYRDSWPISGGNVGEVVTFPVPADEVSVLAGGTLDLYYFVQPVSGSLMESPHETLQVAGAAALAEPSVDHAAGGVLDPDAVPTGGTTVRVAPYAGMAPGDVVRLFWDGRDSSSSFTDFFPVGSSWGQREIPFRLAKRYVTDNLGHSVQAHYTVTPAGGATKPSRRLTLQIRAATAARPAPAIREAVGTALDPVAAQTHLTALVTYPDVQAGDTITVTWTGAPGTPAEGSHTTAPVPVGAPGTQEIALPVSVVAFSLGRTVTVTYTVTRAGVAQPSDPLTLAVGSMPATGLPRPQIPEASGGELRVHELAVDPTVRVTPWPLIAAGQRAWLRLRGTRADGSAYLEEVLLGAPVTGGEAAAGIAETIARGELQGLRDNSALDIEFKVTFDRSGSEGAAVTFPVATYRINAALTAAPTITLIKDDAGTTIANGGTTVSSVVTLVGTAAANRQVEIFDGAASRGTVTADGSGTWTLALDNLVTGPHNYTVQARYGSQPVSSVYSITVVAAAVPAISSIKDSAGATIAHDGVTVSTTITLTGTASANQQVEIFDNGASLGTVTTTGSGTWTRTITSVPLGKHSYTAEARYGSQPVSPAYAITVAEAITPVIAEVRNTSQQRIPHGGTTTTPGLYVFMRATPGLPVELYDGATLIGSYTNPDGVWAALVNLTEPGAHHLTLKAKYGSEPVSAVYTVHYAPPAPTITTIKDSSGATIANNGSTLSTSVTLSGTGAVGQQVEIFDGATSRGTVTVQGSGTWSLPLSGLSAASHSFTAKAKYGAEPVSAAYKITVLAAITPVISTIKDSSGKDIANNGTTFFTSVTLSGTATAGQEVEIFDGATSRGTVPANSSGAWSLPLNGLSVASHSFTAKAKYGSEPVSAAYKITVAAATTPAISTIKDHSGKDIPNGGSVTTTNITIHGTAAAGQQVEIFDGATSHGTVTANSSGAWSRAISSPANGARNYTAKAKYGSQPVSAAYKITIVILVTPVIDEIREINASGRIIPNGGSTKYGTMHIKGRGAPGKVIIIHDSGNHGAICGDDGMWYQLMTGQQQGTRRYQAAHRDGPGGGSNYYTVNIT